jgi:hypothetical protein
MVSFGLLGSQTTVALYFLNHYFFLFSNLIIFFRETLWIF